MGAATCPGSTSRCVQTAKDANILRGLRLGVTAEHFLCLLYLYRLAAMQVDKSSLKGRKVSLLGFVAL